MKRNTLDKQILKALTIGLSASMALQPVTAFAHGANPDNASDVPQNPDTVDVQEIQQETPSMNTEVAESIDTAQEAVTGAMDQAAAREGKQETEKSAIDNKLEKATAPARVLGAGRGGSAMQVDTGEAVDATIVDASETISPEKEEKTIVDTVAIEDEGVALSSSIPEEAKKGFPWWILVILASITGVSVEEYYRRRQEKIREESAKKDN